MSSENSSSSDRSENSRSNYDDDSYDDSYDSSDEYDYDTYDSETSSSDDRATAPAVVDIHTRSDSAGVVRIALPPPSKLSRGEIAGRDISLNIYLPSDDAFSSLFIQTLTRESNTSQQQQQQQQQQDITTRPLADRTNSTASLMKPLDLGKLGSPSNHIDPYSTRANQPSPTFKYDPTIPISQNMSNLLRK